MDPTSTQQLEEFFSHYTAMHYDKGERILREYDASPGVFYIRQGVIRVYLISEEGNELTALMHSTHNIFPLRWAMAGLPNIYNYQSMNGTEVWRAPREAFLDFIKEHPDSLMQVSQQLIMDCSALVYRLQHTVFGNAYAKVAAVVLTAGKRFSANSNTGGSVVVEVPLTHQQIADSAGITRETASLEMKKLKEEGLISYKGRSLIINDIESLGKASFL
ncbi:Crp/Fnr family transcriptional regulator [Patescibacteria group bacterium]|nr:Crp/Fnr family transcriptional regulator [Patescibacteria group bacterium]